MGFGCIVPNPHSEKWGQTSQHLFTTIENLDYLDCLSSDQMLIM